MFKIYYIIIIVVLFIAFISEFDNYAATPQEIYKCTNLNMFACILLFLFLLIINPLFYIAKFLYFIFHVGRKD